VNNITRIKIICGNNKHVKYSLMTVSLCLHKITKSKKISVGQNILNEVILTFRPYGDFTRRVKFCHATARDVIRAECDGGWGSNFDLFGGTEETIGTLKLHNYYCTGPGGASSNLFLDLLNSDDCSFQTFTPDTLILPGNICKTL